MEQTSLFILFIFLVASSIILRKSKQARKKLPPGPWPLPVIGNLHQLDRDRLHRSLLALSRRHGPLMFLRLGAVPTLVVSSSEVAEEIFRRHDLTFSGRPRLAASRRLLYNHSTISFSSYGDHWRQARKISISELFSSRRVRAFRAVREREVANLVAAISATDQKEMFIAGTETASITTTWTMTELMRNPRVMGKVLRELQQMFGSKCGRLIEESEVEKLEYLKLVVKESLRLHPPAPLLLPRETMEPCTIQGFELPAKTRVLINAVAISTDPSVWERPLEFWPERFEDRSVDFKGQDFELIPFGAGRRICPGMSFGVAVIGLALANLLHCFDWAMPDGMKAEDIDMEEAVGISVRKKVPLWLVAKSKWGALRKSF